MPLAALSCRNECALRHPDDWVGPVTRRRPLRTLALIACAFGLTALAACDLRFGASFDYPNQPPLPSGSTVIAKAKGWDDDDPMRGREVVIDIGTARPAEVVEFYRERFPPTEGWLQGAPDPDVGGGHLLCLVRHSDKEFDEYVEIYPYHRGFKSAGPHRYLTSISRLYVMPEWGKRTVNRCGQASIWFPTNL